MKMFALLAMEASLYVLGFVISASTPLLTVVEPLYVFTPAKTHLPVPTFVMELTPTPVCESFAITP